MLSDAKGETLVEMFKKKKNCWKIYFKIYLKFRDQNVKKRENEINGIPDFFRKNAV